MARGEFVKDGANEFASYANPQPAGWGIKNMKETARSDDFSRSCGELGLKEEWYEFGKV